jgi:ATP-dependent DNA ligase
VKEMQDSGDNANTLDIVSVTDLTAQYAAEEKFPTFAEFIKPMLAKALPEEMDLEDFTSGNYVMEEKFNGHRMEITVAKGMILGRSRNGLARKLPDHIMEECFLLDMGTYDGELFIPGGVSTDVVDLELQGNANLILFDRMSGAGVSFLEDPLHIRRDRLVDAAQFLPNNTVRLAEQYDVSRDMLEKIWAAGGEGAIIKHIMAPYRPGKRTLEWVKLKKEQHAELTIVGFQAGRLGPHSKIVLEDEHGVTISVKSRNDAWRAEFDKDFAKFLGKKLIISYQEKTRDGKYWHPMADHFVE